MGSIGLAHLKIRYFIQTGGRVYSKWIMCLSLKGRQTISNNKFPRLGQSSKRCQISSKTWGQGFLLGSLLLLFPNMQHHATNLRPGRPGHQYIQYLPPKVFASHLHLPSFSEVSDVCGSSLSTGSTWPSWPWSLPRKAGFVGLVVFSSTQAMHPQLVPRSRMYQDSSCLALALYMVVTSYGQDGQASRGIHKSPPKVATKSLIQSRYDFLKLLRQTKSKKR